MTDAADRHVLRATFDGRADTYDRARPVAPPEVFDDLVSLARLSSGARLLEIGCGTGKATLPLAERGFEITAVELGSQMADVARRNLAGFPRVEILTSSFEDWDAPGVLFDTVVSFNAFHWIDPDVRFAKSAASLHPGGSLAVFGGRFAEHADADPVWLELQEDYVATTGEPEPRLRMDELSDRSAEFEEGAYFRRPTVRRYQWEATFDADDFVELLSTMSWYAALEDDVRHELFERIRARILSSSTQTIAPTTAAVLYVAERA